MTKLAVETGIRYSHDPPKSDDELQNAKFVWIEGLKEDSEAFCGEIRAAAGVTGVHPARIGAYWFLKPGLSAPADVHAKPGEIVAMHIHGGAFHVSATLIQL